MASLRDRNRRHDAFFRKARSEGFAARSVYKLEEIDRRLPGSGLYITGNYFGGLAIEDCSLRSAKEAERLLKEA